MKDDILVLHILFFLRHYLTLLFCHDNGTIIYSSKSETLSRIHLSKYASLVKILGNLATSQSLSPKLFTPIRHSGSPEVSSVCIMGPPESPLHVPAGLFNDCAIQSNKHLIKGSNQKSSNTHFASSLHMFFLFEI